MWKLCFVLLALFVTGSFGHGHKRPHCNSACRKLRAHVAAAKKEEPTHPLHPLTWREAKLASDLLFASPLLPESRIIHTFEVLDPPKEEVLAWRPGQRLPRRAAYAVVSDFSSQVPRQLFLMVDLTAQHVSRNITGFIRGARRPESIESFLLTHPALGSSLSARNLTVRSASCSRERLLSGGSQVRFQCGPKERRLRRSPLSIFRVTYTLATRSVSGLIDRLIEAAPSSLFRTGRKAVSLCQPKGVNFRLIGKQVEWFKWKFLVRLDRRAGLVISRVSFTDGGADRSILYEGHLSELFVPYMTPDFPPSYFDAGVYEIGGHTGSLKKFTDCPKHARYLDGVLLNSFTAADDPQIIPDAICVFERYAGDTDIRSFGKNKFEPRITLVVRSWANIGNYDYGFDWEFFADGTIKVAVNTGGYVLNNPSFVPQNLFEAGIDPTSDGISGLYGGILSQGTFAPTHDHFASFRMDLDVDGTSNSFVRRRLVRKIIPESSSRKSIYEINQKTALTELEGRYRASALTTAEFVLTNPSKRTYLGNVVGYKLVLRNSINNILVDDDAVQKQAGFTKYSIWVTPYTYSERWAAGVNPGFQDNADGLPIWVQQGRNIQDTDLVLWPTIGIHHIPTEEDWPEMPVLQMSFELKPNNFFSNSTIQNATPYTEAELECSS